MHEKHFVVAFLLVLVSFSMISYPAFAATIEKDQLMYEISGGSVTSIEADDTFTSLVINLDANNDGKLTIDIPRDFMDSKIGAADDHFFVLIDNQEVIPQENKSNQKRTLTISFEKDSETIEIIGTKMNLDILEKQTMDSKEESIIQEPPKPETETTQEISESIQETTERGGCLIATAAYGSELAPQIQELRETRDRVLKTEVGLSFMTAFNQIYYSFSPQIANLEREYPVFKESVKLFITPMVSSLSILDLTQADTENEVLVFGSLIISLNLGMYVGIPAFAIISIRKRI